MAARGGEEWAAAFFLTIVHKPFEIPINPSAVAAPAGTPGCIPKYNYSGYIPRNVCAALATVEMANVLADGFTAQSLQNAGNSAAEIALNCNSLGVRSRATRRIITHCLLTHAGHFSGSGKIVLSITAAVKPGGKRGGGIRPAIGVLTVFYGGAPFGGGVFEAAPSAVEITAGAAAGVLATAAVRGAEEEIYGRYTYSLRRANGGAVPEEIVIGVNNGIIRLVAPLTAAQTLTLEVLADNGRTQRTTQFVLEVKIRTSLADAPPLKTALASPLRQKARAASIFPDKTPAPGGRKIPAPLWRIL